MATKAVKPTKKKAAGTTATVTTPTTTTTTSPAPKPTPTTPKPSPTPTPTPTPSPTPQVGDFTGTLRAVADGYTLDGVTLDLGTRPARQPRHGGLRR